MIFITEKDITKIKVDAIVSPVNGIYIMNRGVSATIASACGKIVEEEIENQHKKNGYLKEGDFFRTSSGDLSKKGINYIYYAIVNDTPSHNTSIYSINSAARKILDSALKDKISSIAFTGLGSGCCLLNKKIVVINMLNIFREYNGLLDIYIADTDKELIDIFREQIRI